MKCFLDVGEAVARITQVGRVESRLLERRGIGWIGHVVVCNCSTLTPDVDIEQDCRECADQLCDSKPRSKNKHESGVEQKARERRERAYASDWNEQQQNKLEQQANNDVRIQSPTEKRQADLDNRVGHVAGDEDKCQNEVQPDEPQLGLDAADDSDHTSSDAEQNNDHVDQLEEEKPDKDGDRGRNGEQDIDGIQNDPNGPNQPYAREHLQFSRQIK